MLAVITLNAIVLGAETYGGVRDRYGDALHLLNEIFLGFFVVELVIRLVACWPRPGRFFSNGWNVFDFVVVVASFLPGLRENATLLRLLRLARIVRAVRFLPDLRVVLAAVVRSVPGVSSLAVMTLLLVYLYGMVGWVIFHDHDPGNFGNVGQAMVTMFVLLTLENLPTYIERGQDLSDWTLLFYLSYVLVASFLIFNLFIGIVINSMEEARAEEQRRARDAERAAAAASDDAEDDLVVAVEDRIDDLRRALDELEDELRSRRRGAQATAMAPTTAAAESTTHAA
ncbi:MAG: voltage-gated sodium channel [Solirubrobacteraceae bacterium]|jgi:voltage-gated sodium channel|nr:voltage-gated sodium channel [Solirubrobacteraceae bacterium]